MKIILIAIASCIVFVECTGQNIYQKSYGGPGNDVANGISITSDNGYVVIGSVQDTSNLNTNIGLVKTDSAGAIQWTKIYGLSNSNEHGYSVVESYNGSYILGCETGNGSNGMIDILIMNIDATGNIIWSKVIGGSGNDYLSKAIISNDSTIVVAGSTESYGAGGNDIYLVKLSLAGNLQWAKTYGGADGEESLSMSQADDGGYLIAGRTKSFSAGDYDMYLVKTNIDGDLIFDKSYGGPLPDWCYTALSVPSGGYLLSGFSNSYGSGWNDVYLIKTDSVGNAEWERAYGDSGHHDFAQAMVISKNGNILLSGGERYKTIMTTSNGDTLWTSHFGGNNPLFLEIPSGIAASNDGFAIAGKTKSFGPSSDFYLVKIDTNGNSGCYQKPTKTYITNSVSVSNTGAIVDSGGTITDFAIDTISFTFSELDICDTIIGIHHPISSYNQLKVWPNPVNNTINISGEKNIKSVTVVGLTGKELAIYPNPNGSIYIGNLMSGIYLLRIETKSGNHYKKIIKQ